jgi:anti-sigma B factor antagonist
VETFRIKAVPGEGTCTLILSGEADLAVADDVTELGTLGLEEPATQQLVVDLAAVTFIDSTTLGALVHLRNVAADNEKTLKLVNVPDRVGRVLHIAGLDKVFATGSPPGRD